MALTTAYDSGLLTLTDGSTAFATDACYAILVNGYTFSAAHTQYSDASASELGDVDYDPVALASKTVTLVTGNVLFDCATISFGDPVSIGPADGLIILKGSAASPTSTDPLLFYAPLSDVQSTDAVFQITTADGVYQINRD